MASHVLDEDGVAGKALAGVMTRLTSMVVMVLALSVSSELGVRQTFN